MIAKTAMNGRMLINNSLPPPAIPPGVWAKASDTNIINLARKSSSAKGAMAGHGHRKAPDGLSTGPPDVAAIYERPPSLQQGAAFAARCPSAYQYRPIAPSPVAGRLVEGTDNFSRHIPKRRNE
ncbi:hypothetical protein LZD57_18255 [Jiella sp. CBK1P-4]|uniref:Uncharacterized protein n=1 Tax=Jiella avicenniae TaxID=2907202 RepID=A0A9X1TDB9_9HYPH|nr:hypothetical protein [Jiella avicenniae]